MYAHSLIRSSHFGYQRWNSTKLTGQQRFARRAEAPGYDGKLDDDHLSSSKFINGVRDGLGTVVEEILFQRHVRRRHFEPLVVEGWEDNLLGVAAEPAPRRCREDLVHGI